MCTLSLLLATAHIYIQALYWLRQLLTAVALLLVMFTCYVAVAVVVVRSPPLITDIKTRMGGRV